PGLAGDALLWLDRLWSWLLCRDLVRQIGYARLRLRVAPEEQPAVTRHVPAVMAELDDRLRHLGG
ncbi:MAG: hypothetical protein CVU38_04950, partial [Chloroflexi bacterium HGW-Chloroflexi-1]